MRQLNPFLRSVYLLEPLERRYLLAMVPLDLTVGVPFDGLIATGLRLPTYADRMEWPVMQINGQYDYEPRRVFRADGTFDLYARLTPQRSGTGEMLITFRNETTEVWDTLESRRQTIKPSHFDSRQIGLHIYNEVPGTKMREALASFQPTEPARPLDEYVVEVNWFGQTKFGKLVREADGSVSAYVNAYLPIEGDANVTTTIKLKSNGAPAGYSEAYISSRGSIGIGSYDGGLTSDTGFNIRLPNATPFPWFHKRFVPASELEEWDTIFSVAMSWQYNHDEVASSSATLVRYSDGSHALVGEVPPDVQFNGGQFWITETVRRPAVDGMPAETYTVEYVASFDLVGDAPAESETPVPVPTEFPPAPPAEQPTERPEENPTEQPTETPTETPTENPTENPTDVPVGGGTGVEDPTGADPDGQVPVGTGGMIILVDGSRFGALSSGDGFDPLVASLFRTVGDDTLAEDEAELAPLPA